LRRGHPLHSCPRKRASSNHFVSVTAESPLSPGRAVWDPRFNFQTAAQTCAIARIPKGRACAPVLFERRRVRRLPFLPLGNAEGMERQLMARVRSKGNKTTEIVFASLLRKAQLRGWRRHQPMFGHLDFVWKTAKLVVFVDGCFWHGHRCGKNISPKTNAEAWRNKITRNRKRDRNVTKQLRRRGWTVLRIWECQVAKNSKKWSSQIRHCIKD